MNYPKNYERCCLEETNALQRWFIRLLTRKGEGLSEGFAKWRFLIRTVLYVAVEAAATYKIMWSLARKLEFRKWL